MKPTSIVFIVISAILIISGIIVCVIAGGLAKNDGIDLYSDYYDANGNAVTDYDLTGKKLSEINVSLKNVEIEIVGGEDRTHITVENMPVKSYEYWITDGSVNFKTANVLSIFTSLRINESGFGFNGLRHYLALGRYKDKAAKITVHVSSSLALEAINVEIENGSVTVISVDPSTEIDISTGNGNITLEDVYSPGKCRVKCDVGDVTFNNCFIGSTSADVLDSGDLTCRVRSQYSFALKTVSGSVFIEDENAGKEYSGLYPEVAPEPEKTDDKEKTPETNDKKDDVKEVDPSDTGPVDVETLPEPEARKTFEGTMYFVGRAASGNIKISFNQE